MKNTVKSMDSIENHDVEIEKLTRKIEELELLVKWYQEQFRLNQHKLFGRSSEKTVTANQLSLFEDETSKPEVPEPTIEEISYKRKKKMGHRKEALKDLPVETIEYTIPEGERICCQCNGDLHKMSTETRRELCVQPATVKVIEHVQAVYTCRNCEKHEESTPVVTAPMPKPPIPGSIASSSLIAYIMIQKCMFGLPLYRQEQQWHQMDVTISRQNMANWVITAAIRWLNIVFDRMQEVLKQQEIVHADETTVQVLQEPGKTPESESYMWLYRTGRDGPPIVLFEYQSSRGGKHPKQFLKGYTGYLCTDGYAGYNVVSDVTQVCCFAHARRKFDEALKSLPKEARSKTSLAQEGLNFCNRLFRIEKELHDASILERYEKRLEKSKPILEEFHTWLKKNRPIVLPKSGTGKAFTYCLNVWHKLTNFLKDGRLYLDNNISERSIKQFVIGRKNFLFCNSQKGATASAVTYSIVETAKENGLKPFEYIQYLLRELPNVDVTDRAVIDRLLPWSEAIPTDCKLHGRIAQKR